MAMSTEEEVIVLMLSHMKVHKKKNDIIANGTLDNLIRNNLITNEMATSFMNDSAYANHISRDLIAMAESLFVLSHDNIVHLSEDYMDEDEDSQ